MDRGRDQHEGERTPREIGHDRRRQSVWRRIQLPHQFMPSLTPETTTDLLTDLQPLIGTFEHKKIGKSVSTDLVFTRPDGTKSLVIAAKITTRERIVQPYAHQRILDSKFGEGRFVSVLACVSETQRDEDDGRANMICVPGTVRLFQQHLARLGGIYYLDPPTRYLAEDVTRLVPVNTIGHFLTVALPGLV